MPLTASKMAELTMAALREKRPGLVPPAMAAARRLAFQSSTTCEDSLVASAFALRKRVCGEQPAVTLRSAREVARHSVAVIWSAFPTIAPRFLRDAKRALKGESHGLHPTSLRGRCVFLAK